MKNACFKLSFNVGSFRDRTNEVPALGKSVVQSFLSGEGWGWGHNLITYKTHVALLPKSHLPTTPLCKSIF